METRTVLCSNDVGLHARPASLFVKLAAKYKSKIWVRNFTKNNAQVDAKSILRVLTLGVEKGHMVEIVADGPDEAQAVMALEHLILSDFSAD